LRKGRKERGTERGSAGGARVGEYERLESETEEKGSGRVSVGEREERAGGGLESGRVC
jgi:hypothetical protein